MVEKRQEIEKLMIPKEIYKAQLLTKQWWNTHPIQKDPAHLLNKKQPAISRPEAGGCYKTYIEKVHKYANALGINLEVKHAGENCQ